jgi:ComF family protein
VKGGLCRRCRLRLQPLDGAFCAYEYAPPLSDAIARLKYEGRDELAAPLAGCFARGLEDRLTLPADAVVLPVPLYDRRLRERGFDQSWLLARGLCTSLPSPRASAIPRLLRRTRHTAAQVGLGRLARERNVEGAFAVPSARGRERIFGHDVVLIDDVLTTGATLRAAAAALRSAGARSVIGVTLARAPT